MRAVLLLLGTIGCSFHAGFDGTRYQCGDGDVCPGGQSCVAGECVVGGPDAAGADAPGGGDAALGPDAGADAAPPAVRCGGVTLLADPFDAVTPLWDAFATGGATTAIASGRLTVSVPAGTGTDLAGLQSRYLHDLAEAQVAVDVSQVGGHATALDVIAADGGRARIAVVDGALIAALATGGGNLITKAQVTYASATHRKWRVREQAGTTYWEWSTDGSAWTALYQQADPFRLDPVLVQLSASGALAAASQARFDGVNVDATPSAGPCAAGALVDGFASAAIDPGWQTWSHAGATVGVNNSAMRIATDGAANEYAGFQTGHLYDLRGSALYIDARTVPRVSPSAFVTWLQVMGPAQGNTMLQVDVDGTTLTLRQYASGTATSTQTLTYDPAAHRYWRVRASADGKTLFADTSPDASTWTQRLSTTAMFDPGAVMFVIGAGEYAATAARTVEIGGVNTP